MAEWRSDWVAEWLSDWVVEWLSDWVAEWLSGRVTGWQGFNNFYIFIIGAIQYLSRNCVLVGLKEKKD